MEFYINRTDLAGALGAAATAVGRPASDVLAHVHLRADGERLTVTRTNLEAAYVAEVPCNAEAGGEAVVLADSLTKIVRSLPDETVRVRLTHRLEVESGRSSFALPIIEPSEYPQPSALGDVPTCDVDGAALAVALERAAVCVSHEEVRWGINGAKVEHEDGTLRFVTTDRHRLAIAEVAVTGDVAMPDRMLIPAPMLTRIVRVFPDGPLTLAFGTEAVEVRSEGRRLWFRLLDGEFPDYRAVLPTEHKHDVTLSRERLADACKRVALLAGRDLKATTVEVGTHETMLSYRSPEGGEVSDEVPSECALEPITFGVNADYLADALRTMGGDTVRLRCAHPLAPVLVTSEDATFVVMPMRIE